jgi:hypothetical protein
MRGWHLVTELPEEMRRPLPPQGASISFTRRFFSPSRQKALTDWDRAQSSSS